MHQHHYHVALALQCCLWLGHRDSQSSHPSTYQAHFLGSPTSALISICPPKRIRLFLFYCNRFSCSIGRCAYVYRGFARDQEGKLRECEGGAQEGGGGRWKDGVTNSHDKDTNSLEKTVHAAGQFVKSKGTSTAAQQRERQRGRQRWGLR